MGFLQSWRNNAKLENPAILRPENRNSIRTCLKIRSSDGHSFEKFKLYGFFITTIEAILLILCFWVFFTVLISCSVGLSCAFARGKVILEAAILASVVVVSLTVYTFWAAKRGRDFNFLGPFLFAALYHAPGFCIDPVIFPLGKFSSMIYGGVATVVFCAYMVYDTDMLIKHHTYDQYIWAAVSLYLDGINLFLFSADVLQSS